MRSLTQPKRAVHEEIEHLWVQCDHKATSKGHLAEQKRVVH